MQVRDPQSGEREKAPTDSCGYILIQWQLWMSVLGSDKQVKRLRRLVENHSPKTTDAIPAKGRNISPLKSWGVQQFWPSTSDDLGNMNDSLLPIRRISGVEISWNPRPRVRAKEVKK
jgi:hypothetical protein